MLLNICTILLVCGVVACNGANCDSQKCKTIPKHYEELGCYAVKKAGECCASRYECPNITDRDGNKCHYKNQTFNPRETLDHSKLKGICSGQCYCREKQDDNIAEFECAHIDCPEFFGTDPSEKDCIRQYNNNDCCSSKSICGDAVDKLATCEFEGKTYREGQKMYPKHSCYSCYCAKGFQDKPVQNNRHCFKIDCGITLRNTGRLHEGCIPVYYGDDNCCPIGWRCPGDKHNVPNNNARSGDTGTKCKFGKWLLNKGEKLEGTERCEDCTCTTPPMLHCIKTC
ncbi:unnamed protein product [Diamesa hyperborea]